jgi:hypothetical protein
MNSDKDALRDEYPGDLIRSCVRGKYTKKAVAVLEAVRELMHLLLDKSIPNRLRRFLPGHDVKISAYRAGPPFTKTF